MFYLTYPLLRKKKYNRKKSVRRSFPGRHMKDSLEVKNIPYLSLRRQTPHLHAPTIIAELTFLRPKSSGRALMLTQLNSPAGFKHFSQSPTVSSSHSPLCVLSNLHVPPRGVWGAKTGNVRQVMRGFFNNIAFFGLTLLSARRPIFISLEM